MQRMTAINLGGALILAILAIGITTTVLTTDTRPNDTTSNDTTPIKYNFIDWESTGLAQTVPNGMINVTDILIDSQRNIIAAYMDNNRVSHILYSEDVGASWNESDFNDKLNIRETIERQDGTLMTVGTGENAQKVIYTSTDHGHSWEPLTIIGDTQIIAGQHNVWDIAEDPNGDIFISTDTFSANDQIDHEAVVFRLDKDNQLTALPSLDGYSALSLVINTEGVIYVSTQESNEHDNAEIAGQARVYRSTNHGESWDQLPIPEGANRIYDLELDDEGTLWAGTGLYGELLKLPNDAREWITLTHVPAQEKPFGSPPLMTTYDATRIYRLFFLKDGRLMVGTGNKTGGIFITEDGGQTWEETGATGDNIVAWGFAQDPKTGRIWTGTGSRGGDIFSAMP